MVWGALQKDGAPCPKRQRFAGAPFEAGLEYGAGPPVFQARQRVIYGDTDQMGVVYYANYLRYFEHARNELFRAHGGTYRAFEAQGLMLPVVEAGVSYRAPARYDDLLLIDTEVSAASRVRLTFVYVVRREGEQAVLCEGHTVHACVTTAGKPARLPDYVVKLVARREER
jgi:acyl-CoA thioester hydrolase